jgi:UDP-4-amino-4,6-dideoxy-N-acetyl-beta-L-altrosamine N-acetyltransferase
MELRTNIELEEAILINYVNLSDEEKEMVRNWRNHETIRKWMYQEHIISPEEHAEFVQKLKQDTKNFYWLVKSKDDLYLGMISLNRVDSRNKNAYLGIYANPDRKMARAGNVLVKCLKKLAFNIAGLHTLRLEVTSNNERAINFYKRSGFSEEGKLREFVLKDEKWHDVIVMGMIRRDGAEV